MSRRIARAAGAAALVAVLLGACGGKDANTTVTAGEGKTVDTKAVAAAHKAQKVVLAATDLPGYDVSAPTAIDATGTKAASTFQNCAGAAAALGDADRAAVSPGFYKGGTTMVASIALVSADKDGAEQAMADLSRDDVAICLTTLFKDVLLLDQVPGTTTVTERLPASKVSDESITWRTTIQVTTPQGLASLYSDLTLFRHGRTVAGLFNVQAGTPFPSAERQRLLKSMIERTD